MQRVDCVVCVRNGARFISQALASAHAQLQPEDDILVIDDGSSDGTPELARAFSDRPVRVLSMPPSGLAAARNLGISQTGGDLIAFLDHDDLWADGGLAALRATLDSQPDAIAAFGSWQNFIDPANAPAQQLSKAIRLETDASRIFVGGVFRREAFDRYGKLKNEFPDYTDNEWMMRTAAGGAQFVSVPALHLRRRIHDRNMSWRKTKEDFLEFVHRTRKNRR